MYHVNTDCTVYGVPCVWSKMISGEDVLKRKEKKGKEIEDYYII